MKIETDKILHALACFFVSVVVFVAMFAFGFRGWAVATAAIAAAVVGFAKELWDKMHPESHTAEWADIYADGVGALLALVAELVIVLTM